MSLNLFVVFAAIVAGVVAAIVVISSMPDKSEWAALGRGVLTAAVISVVAQAGVVLLVGGDIFAAAHLVYVIITVGAPLAALIVIVRTGGTRVPFRLVLIGLMLLAPIGLYATHVEPFWLRTDLVFVDAPAHAGIDVRIGVLADLQAESIGSYEQDAVTALLDQRPDIVLIPGDVWQMSREDFAERSPEFAAVIDRICGQVDHVYLVRGNTDNIDGLREITAGSSAIVLDNEVADVTVRDSLVRILGVTFGGDDVRFESARAAFAQPAAGEEPFRIVLAHQPDEVYRFAAEDPVDLLVAGHTHGGQIALPFIGPLVTLSSVPRAVAAGGLGEVDGHQVYVSTGVGRERRHAPQVRFGVRPSIGVIELGAGGLRS